MTDFDDGGKHISVTPSPACGGVNSVEGYHLPSSSLVYARDDECDNERPVILVTSPSLLAFCIFPFAFCSIPCRHFLPFAFFLLPFVPYLAVTFCLLHFSFYLLFHTSPSLFSFCIFPFAFCSIPRRHFLPFAFFLLPFLPSVGRRLHTASFAFHSPLHYHKRLGEHRKKCPGRAGNAR